MLELDHLKVQFDGTQVDFTLKVENGEWLAIIGPSGAGKTTLLNLIGGFLTPMSGTLAHNGTDLLALPPASRPVTTLLQEHNLFAHMTAAQNVGLGFDPGLKLNQTQKDGVADALDQVGLSRRAQAGPGEMSGGERQRVALARALVRRKPLLLLDEPLGQMDPALRSDTLRLISTIREKHNLTVLMVLHTPAEAIDFVDRFVFIGGGKVAASFAPADLTSRHLPTDVLDYLGP